MVFKTEGAVRGPRTAADARVSGRKKSAPEEYPVRPKQKLCVFLYSYWETDRNVSNKKIPQSPWNGLRYVQKI